MLDIIIPVYKARETLPNLLHSLAAQTYKMFFVTIVQDCDGEDYSDIINRFKKDGLHINLLQMKENGGPGKARQYGIDNCGRCDYLMFIDADDLVTPRAVEILYKEAKKNFADIILSDFIAEKERGTNGLYMDSERIPITWMHGKIYSADYLKKNNIRFLDELRLNEDSYFNLVAVNSTKNKKYIKEYTYIWRHNDSSLTRNGTQEDFFRKSWEQYVYGQLKAIQKIIEITGTINVGTLAMTILNIYNHCMTAAFLNLDFDEELFHIVSDLEEVQKFFTDKPFWGYIDDKLRASSTIDENFFFYKERFIDWFKRCFLKDKEFLKRKKEDE